MRQRFLALDGIRGLAIIAVLVTHASYIFQTGALARLFVPLFKFGWCGVDLFFVLSGFLITGILIDTKAALNKGSSFYARRILRILPIYYLTLGLVLFAMGHSAWVATVAEIPTWRDRLSYLFYFQNFAPLWHNLGAHQTLLSHFWSLAVEEQFYFVWPLLVWSMATKTVYKVCAVALCVEIVLRTILGAYFGFGAWIFLLTFTRADGLFVGAALAALLATRHQLSKRFVAGFALAGSLALLVVALFGRSQVLYGGPLMSTFGFSALAILCGVLIAFCLQFETTPAARFFRLGPMRSFGKYSYGLYVFHLPLYYLLDHFFTERFGAKFPLPLLYAVPYLGLLLAVSYGVAWLSFNYFEQRFLRFKRNFDPVFGPAATATVDTSVRELDRNFVET